MAVFPDIGTTFTARNLGEGTLTIGSGSDMIVANGSDITITTSQCIETGYTRIRMSRDFGDRLYREDLTIDARYIQSPEHHRFVEETIRSRINDFERTTSFAATASSGTYTTSSATVPWTMDTVWYYPEEVTFYNPEPISTTSGCVTYTDYDHFTIATDEYRWYVVDSNGNWHIDNVSIKPATHAEVMQKKIDEAWALYCRNENHSKNMQERIEREWWAHLEEERIAEAERIRLLPEKKANELMSMLIGEKEHKVYEKTGRVFVKGKNGLYLVKRGGGVSKIEGNNITDFCVHIETCFGCPPTDHAIALKMMLEDNDSNVIKIANRRMTRTVRELPLAACM